FIVLTLLELLGIVLPVYSLFQPSFEDAPGVLGAVVPILAGTEALWLVSLSFWLLPVSRAAAARRRGGRLDQLAPAAYRALWRLPGRSLALRTSLWSFSALLLGLYLVWGHGWTARTVVELVS